VRRKNTRSFHRIIRLFFRALLFCTVLILEPFSIQAQQAGDDAGAPAYPIPVGEKLAYSIHWDPPWYLFFFPNMHAGDAELEITGGTEYQGRKVLKIIFKARSTGLLAKLSGMKIDDEFVFLSEPDTLCTLSVSKKIREGKRQRQIDVTYHPETRQLHIIEYDESVTPRKIMKDALKDDIPSCVQDPLSALYSLRRSPLEADSVITSVIGHDDVVKEVQSRVEKLENLDTDWGEIPAWRMKTVALMGGLFKKGGQFKIWISADAEQIPVRFEVKVPLGRVLGRVRKAGNRESEESGSPPDKNTTARAYRDARQ